jgi:hypothetical protein
MDSGSCVVGLEQWTGLKGAGTGCLSYCRGTNLALCTCTLQEGMLLC